MTQSPVRTESDQCLDPLRNVLFHIQWASDEESIVKSVTDFTLNQFKYSLVWVAWYCDDRQMLSGSYTLDGKPGKISNCPILAGDLFDQSLLMRHPISITNLKEEKRLGPLQSLALKAGIQGTVLQPIHYKKKPIGVILLGSHHWGINPRNDETLQLSMLANTVGASYSALQIDPPSALMTGTGLSSYSQMLELFMHLQTVEEQVDQVGAHLYQQNEDTICGIYQLDLSQGEFVCPHLYQSREKGAFRSRNSGHSLILPPQSPFARYLESHKVLAISDIQSTVDITTPSTLIQDLKVRALLLSPIIIGKVLQGFVLMGHTSPYVWSGLQKEQCRLAALLLSLNRGAEPDPAIHSISSLQAPLKENNFSLPSPLSPAAEWNKLLANWLFNLGKHLQCKWAILLQFKPEQNQFEIEVLQAMGRRSMMDPSIPFPALSEVDQSLLSRSENAIALIDIAEDLRFLAWRDIFLNLGLKSALIVRAAPRKSMDHVLIFGHDHPRDWPHPHQEQAHKLGQNFATTLEKRDIHLAMMQEKRLLDVFKTGILKLQASRSSNAFLANAARLLADLMDVPVAAILLWPQNRDYAKVKAAVLPEHKAPCSLTVGTQVSLQDPCLQTAILQGQANTASCVIPMASDTLTTETQQWLCCYHPSQLYLVPLKPQPTASVLGVIVLADDADRKITANETQYLADFSQQIAWMLWTTQVTEMWRKDYTKLENLHWYQLKQLKTSLVVMKEACQANSANPEPKDAKAVAKGLNQISENIAHLESIYVDQAWMLQITQDAIPLTRLLRQVLESVDPIVKDRQIWTQVHHLTQTNLSVHSSRKHLEAILEELITVACYRSKTGGRVDIWCRAATSQWLDLSITDNGQINPHLLQALHSQVPNDRSSTHSPMDDGVGRHLKICRDLVRALGGKLEFSQLQDGRSLSRLTLPLVTS